MKNRGAFLEIFPDGSYQHLRIKKLDKDRDINWKETGMAVRGLRRWIRRQYVKGMEGAWLEIRHGSDNTQALAALNSCYYAECMKLTAELVELHDLMQERHLVLRPLYVPGEAMVADEPSRKREVSKQKVLSTMTYLELGRKIAERKRKRENELEELEVRKERRKAVL
jgi:hypothetical protein